MIAVKYRYIAMVIHDEKSTRIVKVSYSVALLRKSWDQQLSSS